MLLPDLARDLEEQSVFNATLNHAAPNFFRTDSIWSERQRTRFTLELRNAATIYHEATWFESLSTLEEDLDHLLKIEKDEATSCREALIFDNYDSNSEDQDLMITSKPQGCFMYRKGKKPSELLGGMLTLWRTSIHCLTKRAGPFQPSLKKELRWSTIAPMSTPHTATSTW
jgi:hypothetical protein